MNLEGTLKTTLKVSNITCANCAFTIEQHFKKTLHVKASVHVPTKRVSILHDSSYLKDDFIHQLGVIGYHVIQTSEEALQQRKKDRLDIWISTLLTIPLLLSMVHHFGIPFDLPTIFMNGYFQWVLTTPLLLFVGRRFFIQTFYQIKSRHLGMDTLVVIGTSSAYLLSVYMTLISEERMPILYFETTAVIIWMVLIGHTFENRVKEKTSDALFKLMALGAKEARVIQGHKEVMMPIQEVKVGMKVRVLANEKIPVDGIITHGSTYVDEQMLTGESMPVERLEQQKVYGATLNMLNTITIMVTETGEHTMLENIIQTVLETASHKPPVQRIADKIANYFVPVVVVISVITFIIWYIILQYPLEAAFSSAISVLVISCPCALGLATPTSISVGSGLAFKRGILYKGGAFFESAPYINFMAFDKTGTLTHGKPVVIEVSGEILQIAASIEYHANHPLAQGIMNHFKGELLDVKDIEHVIGKGIKGRIETTNYFVGSNSWMASLGYHLPDIQSFYEKGQTVIFVADHKQVLGYIVMEDTIRDDAKLFIKHLKKRNIQTMIITGDHEKTARHIANILGIDEVVASVLPKEKAEYIQIKQQKGFHVAYVGDGINDAPALKMANIGIAVKKGHDIALDAADITLMHDQLMHILDALDLSKATLKNIYLNFFWAFIYNIILIPVAAMGLLNPTFAGIGMALSSIMVVLNALRLNLFKFH
jgi:P-type Cu+ transporter